MIAAMGVGVANRLCCPSLSRAPVAPRSLASAASGGAYRCCGVPRCEASLLCAGGSEAPASDLLREPQPSRGTVDAWMPALMGVSGSGAGGETGTARGIRQGWVKASVRYIWSSSDRTSGGRP
jgi:hypothetical protein